MDPDGEFSWLFDIAIKVIQYVTALPYNSADEAAIAFSEEVFSTSQYIRYEMGTVIYKRTVFGMTTYGYMSPYVGEPHKVSHNIDLIPKFTKAVAFAHTHTITNEFSDSQNYDAEFSGGSFEGDIQLSNRVKLNNYVVGPNHLLQKYDVATRRISSMGFVTSHFLTKSQKETLSLKYYDSWHEHNKLCLYGCRQMNWPNGR